MASSNTRARLSALAVVVALSMTGLVGCDQTALPEPENISDIECALVAPALRVPGPRDIDDDLADLVATVPGFGGYFFRAPLLSIFLLDPQDTVGVQAQVSLAALFQSDELSQADRRLLQADFDFRQLVDFGDRAGNLLAIDGVESLDVDESTNRVAVGVSTDEAASCVTQNLVNLQIPSDAVRVFDTEPVGF